jgi:hypothetical protein
LRFSLRQSLQHLLRLFLKSPELGEQVLCGRGRLVAVKVLVRQDFVAKLRAIGPVLDVIVEFFPPTQVEIADTKISRSETWSVCTNTPSNCVSMLSKIRGIGSSPQPDR